MTSARITATLLGPDEVVRTIRRLSHEIIENNGGAEGLVIVGLETRGVPIARRLASSIARFEQTDVPVGTLDVSPYRDDLRRLNNPPALRRSNIPVDIENQTVVLVDDVLYTGRTIRAALDALMEYGRPARVRLAVMVDRGHRELPIRPDFVGKNVPTAFLQSVRVFLEETDGTDSVYLVDIGDERDQRAAPARKQEAAND